MSTKILPLILLVVLVSIPVSGCDGGEDPTEAGLESVILLPQLNFELTDFIGDKVWAIGYYGDESFTGDGVAFLVLNFNMLVVQEKLPEESFARLDGNLPPAGTNGAEVLVYGEVKDFAQTYDVFTLDPTPLVTVEDYVILSEPGGAGDWENSYMIPPATIPVTDLFGEAAPTSPAAEAVPTPEDAATGTKPGNCDRALIISGGIDANNNSRMFRNEIIDKYAKLKELGFSDGQIDVAYNSNDSIWYGGDDIVNTGATVADIENIIEKYQREMSASCTLTILVTDHGTGYNEEQGYHGARPALPGTPEYENGKQYSEGTFTVDARNKVYRRSDYTNPDGEVWRFYVNKETNTLEAYVRVDGEWVLVGSDDNGDGKITETEIGEDIDGDGGEDDFGVAEDELGAWRHRANQWDTDGDGKDDIRVRWDGEKYVMETLRGDKWVKMGEDKNGDFIINGDDGGVDWNLDGDTNDKVGFHEGINLWGDEVLWDDELAEMLAPLSEKGIHILVEMVCCFSGGFVDNLTGIVEKIVAGSSEDTKHYNRWDATFGEYYDAVQRAFVENLNGIDVQSWDDAWEAGQDADRKAWEDAGSNEASENHSEVWETPIIASDSSFEEIAGRYHIFIMIPESLAGEVYDLEIFYGLQKPRWNDGKVLELPEGLRAEEMAGGIKMVSDEPIPLTVDIAVEGLPDAEFLRIDLTDAEHKSLGYILPARRAISYEKPLTGSLSCSVASYWGDYGCESCYDVCCTVDDLTDGAYPITYAALYVDGDIWDSWELNTTHFEETVYEIPAKCGQNIELELVAMSLASAEPVTVAADVVITPTVTGPIDD